MTLRELETGKSAVIRRVGGEGALRQHFLDMGMIPGAEVTVVKLAPMGDPMEVQVHGYELTLRLAEADQIDIEPIRQRSRSHIGADRARDPDHPGLGESGKYHPVQPAHRLKAACGQLPRRHGGSKDRRHPGLSRYGGHRPAGHLLHVALQQRGDRIPELCPAG